MEKTPRYTQRERNMVLGFAARHKEIIENKRTDAESNRKKDEVWLQIAKEFNTQAYHQRSAKQLRQLYKNMKLLLKKDLCGEDRGGNRAFLDLLTTLQKQDSVADYIHDQLSLDSGAASYSGGGAGASGSSGMLNGSGSAIGEGSLNGSLSRAHNDDYNDNSRAPFEAMDTDVILIKSETISDNEQTMDGMDDDDDDCLSSRAPEVCIEEEDKEIFATDLRPNDGSSTTQSNAGTGGVAGGDLSVAGAMQRTTSDCGSPVPSVKLSVSSLTSPVATSTATAATLFPVTPATKTEITISNIGGIRVGAFANLNKTLQNGNGSAAGYNTVSNSPTSSTATVTSNNNNTNNNNSSGTEVRQMQLTAEQVQQHLLLNGLGLSAVHPAAAVALPSLTTVNSTTSSAISCLQSPPRMQRSGGTNGGGVHLNSLAGGAGATVSGSGGGGGGNGIINLNGTASQFLLNGGGTGVSTHIKTSPYNGNLLGGGGGDSNNNRHHHQQHSHSHQQQQQHLHSHQSHGHHHHNNGNSSHQNISLNTSTALANGTCNGSNTIATGTEGGVGGGGSLRSKHNEYLMKLTIEERKRKIDLINAQIEYWQTLTKKLDATGAAGSALPSCLCHFTAAAAANGLQSQASSS